MQHKLHRSLIFGMALFGAVFFAGSTFAASVISSGYNSAQPLSEGTIVALTEEEAGGIEPATPNSSIPLGVVVEYNRALLELNVDSTNTQVVTEGQVDVWVSNINGAIEKGDILALSPIAGIAAKATDQAVIVGVANEAFDPDDSTVVEKDITDELEGSQIVFSDGTKIGKISATINIVDNPQVRSLEGLAGIIQNVNNRLTDTGISPVRVVLSFVLFLAATTVSGVLVYGTVKNSIISIGRNPLSRKSIYIGLAQVMGIGTLIMGIAFAAAYVLLTR